MFFQRYFQKKMSRYCICIIPSSFTLIQKEKYHPDVIISCRYDTLTFLGNTSVAALGHLLIACNAAQTVTPTNSKWPTWGPNLADRVWKGVNP